VGPTVSATGQQVLQIDFGSLYHLCGVRSVLCVLLLVQQWIRYGD